MGGAWNNRTCVQVTELDTCSLGEKKNTVQLAGFCSRPSWKQRACFQGCAGPSLALCSLAGSELVVVAADLSAHSCGPLASSLPQRSILLVLVWPQVWSTVVTISTAAPWGFWGGGRGDEAVQLLPLTGGQQPLVELLLHQHLELTPLLPAKHSSQRAINDYISHPLSFSAILVSAATQRDLLGCLITLTNEKLTQMAKGWLTEFEIQQIQFLFSRM